MLVEKERNDENEKRQLFQDSDFIRRINEYFTGNRDAKIICGDG